MPSPKLRRTTLFTCFILGAIALGLILYSPTSASAQTTGSVHGTVVLEGISTPLANLQIQLHTVDYSWFGTGCTDTNGEYAITGAPVDTLLIAHFAGLDCTFQSTVYLQQYFSNSSSYVTATQFEIPGATGNHTGVDFTLVEGGTISGTVYNGTGTTPLEGMMVYGYNPGYTFYDCTDANGSYTLNGVALDTALTISAGNNCAVNDPQNYAIEYWEETTSFSMADTITLTSGNKNRNGINFTLDEGGMISGTVYAPDSVTPLSNAYVAIWNRTAGSFKWICADANGYYEDKNLPQNNQFSVSANELLIGSVCTHYPQYKTEWWNNVFNENAATLINFTPGNLNQVIDFVLEDAPPTGTISGTVRDTNNNSLSNIAITWLGGVNQAGGTCSDATGNYTMTNIPLDTAVQIYTNIDSSYCGGPANMVQEYWQEATVIHNASLITLTSGNLSAYGIDFTLAVGGTASGTVYNSTGTTPLANVSVWYEGAPYITCTNGNGQWTLKGVPVGVPLKFAAGGGGCSGDTYPTEWYNNTTYTNATPITLSSPNTPYTGINFTVGGNTGNGTITGTIYNNDGSVAQANVQVSAWDRNNYSNWNATVCSDANGNYTFSNVVENISIVVYATGNSYQCSNHTLGSEYWQNTSSFSNASSIVLSAGNLTASGINFTLPPVGTITVTVYDETGTTPLSGVPVTVSGSTFGSIFCSDANGQISYTQVPYGEAARVYAGANPNSGSFTCSGGSYEQEFWQEVTAWDQATLVTVNAANPSANVTFTLKAAGTITGTVRNSSGTPIGFAGVTARTADGRFISAEANNSGAYTLKGVPFNVPVTIYARGFYNSYYAWEWWNEKMFPADADTLMLNAGNPAVSGIDFSLGGGGILSGIVYAEDGTTTLASVAIRVTQFPDFVYCTGSNGAFSIVGLTPGQSYNISAGGSGCINDDYNVEWWQESATLAGATPIVFAGGNHSGINFTLSQGTVSAPSAPTLTAPSGVSYDVNPVFTWTGDTNATHYRLYVQDASTGTVVIDEAFTSASVCTGTNCAVEPAVFLNTGTNYSAWVQAINTSGSAWSNQLDFTVAIEPPSAPTLTAPAANTTDTTPTYGWNEVGGATSYRLFVTDNVGTTVTDETYTDLGSLCSGGACTATPANVLGNGTYNAWLQAINAGGGTWSSAYYFTISTVLPPAAATVTAPSGSTSDTTPLYEWNEVSGATHYRVYVTDAFGTVVVDQVYNSVCAVGLCGVDAGVTLNNGSHTVWVQTSNGAGSGPWSNGLSFMVSSGTAPAATTVTAPSGTTIDTIPTYAWNEVSGATNYRLYVTDAFGAVVIDQGFASGNCTAGTCTADPAVTLSVGSYTTWVLTSNGVGNGPWSAPLGFYVVESAPAAPTLIAPTGAGAGTQPTYQWNESAGATQYRLYVQDAFGTLITNEVVTNSVCSGGVCSHTPSPTLTIGTGYTWWVLAANSGGGNWSASASFVVGSTPGTTTITAPASPTTNTQPTYEWTEVSGATNYRLYVNTVGGTVVIDQVFPSSNCTAGVCSVTPAVTLASSEAYQVWVLASNAIGNGAWAGPYNFSVIP